MKKFIFNSKTALFILATVTVAFLLNTGWISSNKPNADIAEADQIKEVKGESTEKEIDPELVNIPPKLLPEPKIYPGSFLYQDSAKLLADLGVEYDEKSVIIQKGLPAKYGFGWYEVWLYEPQKVFYDLGGQQGVVTTWAKTVEDLIKELAAQGLEIGEADLIEPNRATELVRSDLFSLKITPVEVTTLEEVELLSFKTIVEQDPNLLKGKVVVKSSGQKGKKVYRYSVRREKREDKWRVAAKSLISSEIISEPVDRLEVQGTKVELYGTGKATFYDSPVAAHKTLPFGTLVDVVNLKNGKSVRVKIGDRGPFGPGRVIDLPRIAFAQIAAISEGIVEVKLEKVSQ